jgi:hypothetical protein
MAEPSRPKPEESRFACRLACCGRLGLPLLLGLWAVEGVEAEAGGVAGFGIELEGAVAAIL